MRAPLFWWRRPGLRSRLLAPLGWLYGRAAEWWLKRNGARAAVPVICVGNFTVGGAGKTPTAIAIAQLLRAAGEFPAFLTRGYGGRLPGPVQVDLAVHSAADVGDEPLLLARHFNTIVAADRAVGARNAVGSGASVIVMDDGFQNPSLAKDICLLVVDARRGVGNGSVIPAGPLRAPLEVQLAKTDAVLVIGQGAAANFIAARAQALGIAVFSGMLRPGHEVARRLRGEKVLAFAGIGHPEKFFATAEAEGFVIAGRRSFPDHYRYSAIDAERLIEEAAGLQARLLTTEKDVARMAGDPLLNALQAHSTALPVSLVFDEHDVVREFVMARLHGSAARARLAASGP